MKVFSLLATSSSFLANCLNMFRNKVQLWCYLFKIGICEIKIHDANVRVSVVNNSAFVVAKINYLKSSLQRRVVGLDFKNSPIEKLLLLCVDDQCLIINLSRFDCVPKTLKQFLADETIIFLGIGMSNIVELLQHDDIQCGTGIDVGYLAASLIF